MSLRLLRPWLLLALAAAPFLWADASRAEERRRRPGMPHAGYVYPAGARVGTTVRVMIGGQYLRQIEGIQVSGTGVEATVLYWVPPPRPGPACPGTGPEPRAGPAAPPRRGAPRAERAPKKILRVVEG